MDGMMEFLAMGGYAAYVWPAYGLTAVVMGGMLWVSLKRLRARQRELMSHEALRGDARRRRETREAP